MRVFTSATAAAIFLVGLSRATVLTKRACEADVANIGFATGTTGGITSPPITVTSLAALTSALAGTSQRVVFISGTIAGSAVIPVGSNKSIIGKSGSQLVGVGLSLTGVTNVIIRNVRIVRGPPGSDSISIAASSRVWVDHVDLSNDLDHDAEYYGNLLSITQASQAITVSWSKLSLNWDGVLVSESDDAVEDLGMTITLANNWWTQLYERVPHIRWARGHIFHNLFSGNDDGLNVGTGAQLLVENNVWENCQISVYSTGGQAVLRNHIYCTALVGVPVGNFTSPSYTYTLNSPSTVKAIVTAGAGQRLTC